MTRPRSVRARTLIGAVWGAMPLLLISLTGCLAPYGARPDERRLKEVTRTSRYEDGRFVNAVPTKVGGTDPGTIWEFLFGGQQRTPPGPLAGVDPVSIWGAPAASGLRVTWLGHSTLLLEVDGVRVLTDPFWSDRASPLQWVGPERFHPPLVPLEALPPLDGVIISHDHYDHLDMAAVQVLARTGVRFFVPLGVADHLQYWGVPPAQITELDWWGEALVGNQVLLTATPSRHFSGRGVFDRDRTLWTSWVIRGPQHRAYFSGDTGLTPQFEDIGRRLGPFDLVMLEFGAWDEAPGDIHLGPDGAVEAHRMLGGGPLLPIHRWNEPMERVTELARRMGITLVMPHLGEPIEVTSGASDLPPRACVARPDPHPCTRLGILQ